MGDDGGGGRRRMRVARFGATRRVALVRGRKSTRMRGECMQLDGGLEGFSWWIESAGCGRERRNGRERIGRKRGRSAEAPPTPTRSIRYTSGAHQLFGNRGMSRKRVGWPARGGLTEGGSERVRGREGGGRKAGGTVENGVGEDVDM